MKPIFTFFVFLSFIKGSAQSVIQVAWDFNGSAGNETSVAPLTIASHIQPVLLVRGAGLTPAALANSFNSTGWTTTNSIADAISNKDYLEWTIQPQSGFVTALHQLNANFRRSGTGPDHFQWRYSVDGVHFTDLGAEILFSGTATNGVAQLPIDLQGFPDLQMIPAVQTVYLRLYGYNASASSGSFALGRLTGNDLSITGSTQATTPQQLLRFQAARRTAWVELVWEVTAENRVGHYSIERAAEGTPFQAIGKMVARNNLWRSQYQFRDRLPMEKATLYRLKMIDEDGHFQYSPVVSVNATENTIRFRSIRIAPNQFLLLFPTVHPAGIVSVYTTRGQLFKQWRLFENEAQLKIETGLAAGVWILRFQSQQETFVDRLWVY